MALGIELEVSGAEGQTGKPESSVCTDMGAGCINLCQSQMSVDKSVGMI